MAEQVVPEAPLRGQQEVAPVQHEQRARSVSPILYGVAALLLARYLFLSGG